MHSELTIYTFWILSTAQLWLFKADSVSYVHQLRNYSYDIVNWLTQKLYKLNTSAESSLKWTSQCNITTKLCEVMMSQITTIQIKIWLQLLCITHHRQCVSLVLSANRCESFNMNQCDSSHASLNKFTLIFKSCMIHHHLKTVHMQRYWLMILQESHRFCFCEQKINTLIRWRSDCNRQRMKLMLKWHIYMLSRVTRT